tara:strand:- start:1992 stop:4184 length:2193 start_codon:yes stop_codon:yes gene_type:complete
LEESNLKYSSIKRIIINSIFISFVFLIAIISYLFFLSKDLPSLDELQKFNPEQVTKIISSDDVVIKKLFTHKRDMIDISSVPLNLRNALLCMEDRNFYEHNGINIKGIFRAIIINLASMSTKQGASTLTQQLARNMYNDLSKKYKIGSKKTIVRKLKEFITAIKIEQTYTKSEILELYLNSVYFGHGNYGIQSASIYYFSKDASDLTLDESAILIGLLPAPAIYSPVNHPERNLKRRNLVLKVMLNQGYLINEEYELAIEKDISIQVAKYDNSLAPHFSEHIRRKLEKIDDSLNVNLYKDGLVVKTTLNSEVQNILTKNFNEVMNVNQKVLNKEILNNNPRVKKLARDFNIDIDSLKNILKNNLEIPKNMRKKLLVQGAGIVVNPKNGNILGMIGGRTEDVYLDHFNRATQAKRQPGSVFKPFIYYSALENGAMPCTQLLNQPLVFFIDDTTRWNPQNHDGSTGLLTSLRDGIRRSLNLISVRIVQELITPLDVKKTAEKFGVRSKVKAVDAIALGVSEVYPLDMAMSYSVIANDGVLHKPLMISSITDSDGRSLKTYDAISEEVADEKTIYILRDMMKSVIDKGTGGSLRWRYKFYNPAAGKTGTTNSKTDAWFVGFTTDIAIAIWVGLDDPSMKLGSKQYGSKAALPIFAKTIKDIYDLGEYEFNGEKIILDSKSDWDIPDGILQKNICNESCCLATDWCESYNEYFLEDNIPLEKCEEFSNPLFRFK